MKHVTKRFLAMMLALVLCLSLLPGIAMAADSYVKVTGLSDVTSGGQFVIVANGLAMDTAIQGNKKFNGVAVTPSGSTLSGSLPVWTIEAVEGGIAISVNGEYLGYDTSTNFKMQADPYTWTVSAGANGFVIKSAKTTSRGVFLQTSSSRFGAYSTSNTSGYVTELELYKNASGANICEHDYVSTVVKPVTCTQDGEESCTCSKCGDTFTKVIEAKGHNYVARTCTYCGGVIETDPAKVITEAYALEQGAALPYDAILTGKVVSIEEPYSTQYKNITLTIAVEGYEEQPIECYRLKGAGVETVAVGDTISVFGIIKNYKGKVEFDFGCTVYILAPDDQKQIVADAYALAEGEELPYEATLTGKITSIDDPYSAQYKNITVTMVVEGCEDKPIVCYRMKGAGVEDLKVGDTITATGTIKNFYGKIEFNLPYLIATPAPAGFAVSGAVVTGADGETLVELFDGETQITAAAVNGKEGTYTLENVAAGTYTLKVSKLNHVTREYAVTVEADLTQDVKIHLIGDIDGNSKINSGDVAKLNAHLKGTNLLTDEYMILCANVNGGKLNMGDTATLYAHVKGTKLLH